MDSQVKMRAYEDAVSITTSAFANESGNVAPYLRPKEAAAFLDAVYRKLCELRADSMGD